MTGAEGMREVAAMADRHHVFARFLHWATFLVLAAGYLLIWWRDGLDDPDTRRVVLNWHATVGLTVVVLAAARLIARVLGDGWIVVHDLKPMERRAANLSHALLYAAIVGIPLLGWLVVSAKGRAVSVFGWFDLPLLIGKDRDLSDVLQQGHYYAAMALLAVVAVHVIAALYHHFIRKDGVLRAML